MRNAELDRLLARAVELDASDVFLVAGSAPLASVEKRLVPLAEKALSPREVEALAAPLLEGDRRREFEARPDLDVAYVHERDRFRVNVFKQRGEVALVARRVRLHVPTLEELGLPGALATIALEPRGLFLVTGAAGTGKSTTLAAMIAHRNLRLPGHIVTIEDPIEFVHPHRRSIVTQREVGIDTASFHDALRSALRQAPDVLMLGEVRDAETAEAALHLAETGHLVLATLHATNTIQAVERLVTIFPTEGRAHALVLLALTLAGAVSQRLVPGKEKRRVALCELLLPTQRVRDLVARGDFRGLEVALREGAGEPFDEALHELVVSGRVSEDDALPFADSPGDFRLRLRFEQARPLGQEERRAWRLV